MRRRHGSPRRRSRRPGMPRVLLACVLASGFSVALTDTFDKGSLIIPMDTTYQDLGVLKAHGLVWRLLDQGVTVHRSIATGKAHLGVDFIASAVDLQTAEVITNHGYRGGPFVVGSADRATALSIIADWQVANTTTVHDVTAAFDAEIARTLVSPPRLAVLADGYELVAFDYLNAAGIPDSLGRPWPSATDPSQKYAGFPDVLDLNEVAGPIDGGSPDGALFTPDGAPAYCQLLTMHHSLTPDDEAVREVRLWLSHGPAAHLHAQCLSITTFENAGNGLFLTTAGLRDDGGTPTPLKYWEPDDPLSQLDGPFSGDGGSVNSIGLAQGSTFKPNVRVLIEEDRGFPAQVQMVWVSGFVDGDTQKGRVTYLAGHDYATTVPRTSEPKTNGAVLVLSSLLDSVCTIRTTIQPPPVEDGSTGSPLTAQRISSDGSAIRLLWSPSSCAPDHHVLFGSIHSVDTLAVDGAECAVGNTGQYDWLGVPPGDLWFLMVADGADFWTEGTWGLDGAGRHRSGGNPSYQCGFLARDNEGSCP